MPVTTPITYRPGWLLRNPHVQMIAASMLRNPKGVLYSRENIELPDGDFVSIDWFKTVSARRLAVLLHGLESSSKAPYIRGMVKALSRRDWDCVVINARGCGGEANRLLRAYHSGETNDPHYVINHIGKHHRYEAITLIGFSLGGNVALRYAVEYGASGNNPVAAVAAVSVPCDLASCAKQLDLPQNRIYTQRFLRTLVQKLKHKQRLFPDALDYEPILASKTFAEFDGLYTAPVHGFDCALDYWQSCSSLNVIGDIKMPALLINAIDDPFLTESCHPVDIARNSANFTLDLTARGSHVGFVTLNRDDEYWHETRVCEFLEQAH